MAIVNPNNGVTGTLGIAATDGAAQFLVSCYHVLGRFDFAILQGDEVICQPTEFAVSPRIATQTVARSAADLDCAAAELMPGIQISAEVLGIGQIMGLAEPRVGMRVIKSGAGTGVTEGVILSVQNDLILIAKALGYPHSYSGWEQGDSGAAWLEVASHKVVGMHCGADSQGRAKAIPYGKVLARLGISLMV